jgi:hypothetical protein
MNECGGIFCGHLSEITEGRYLETYRVDKLQYGTDSCASGNSVARVSADSSENYLVHHAHEVLTYICAA